MSPTRNYSGAPTRCFPGFSLVELMVAMSISMVVIAALLSSYTFLGRNLIRYSNQQQLEAQSRRALQMFGQDVHVATGVYSFSASQVTLLVPKVDATGKVITDGAGNLITKNVVYDVTAGTLTRTDPEMNSGTPLTLLTGASNLSFNYLDKQGVSLTLPSYPLRIKQIEVSGFTAASGTATAGTQSIYNGASARLVLRSRHIVN